MQHRQSNDVGNAQREQDQSICKPGLKAPTDNYVYAETSLRKGLADSLLVSSTSLVANPYDTYTADANMADELGFTVAAL